MTTFLTVCLIVTAIGFTAIARIEQQMRLDRAWQLRRRLNHRRRMRQLSK